MTRDLLPYIVLSSAIASIIVYLLTMDMRTSVLVFIGHMVVLMGLSGVSGKERFMWRK